MKKRMLLLVGFSDCKKQFAISYKECIYLKYCNNNIPLACKTVTIGTKDRTAIFREPGELNSHESWCDLET